MSTPKWLDNRKRASIMKEMPYEDPITMAEKSRIYLAVERVPFDQWKKRGCEASFEFLIPTNKGYQDPFDALRLEDLGISVGLTALIPHTKQTAALYDRLMEQFERSQDSNMHQRRMGLLDYLEKALS